MHGATVDGDPASVRRAGHELTLRPRDDIGKGATFRTVVRYSGTPRTVTDPDGSQEGWLPTADGALAVGQPTGSMAWFPGNHHPSDKAAYQLRITVPKGVRAVSNGELTSTRTAADGATTSTWRTAEPMASYLAVLAVGAFEVETSRTASGLPVLTAVDSSVARRGDTGQVLARLPDAVAWGERRFGPYPFSSTGVIVERAEDIGYALETQTRPVFPEDAFTEPVLVHELAHQWYGDSVSPETWRDMWLNEGFATYAEWLYAEDLAGTPARQAHEAAFADDANWAFPRPSRRDRSTSRTRPCTAAARWSCRSCAKASATRSSSRSSRAGRRSTATATRRRRTSPATPRAAPTGT